jgi:hypothetical protein
MAWTAMAGKRTFVVPGEQQARALADAFAAFGYPLVTAGPHDLSGVAGDGDLSAADWTVTVLDEGGYSPDAQGWREWMAVSRSARRLAREHQGFYLYGMDFDVSQVAAMRPGPDVLVRRNPGSRPARPAPGPAAPALVRASLTLECEPPRGGGADLVGLDEVPWASLEHAYGQAGDVPELIRGLARDDGDWGELAAELIGGMVLHQGSCYSATSPVIPFLAQLIRSDAFSASRRAYLYLDLLYAATRHGSSVIADADRAAARGRPPRPAPWTLETKDAVKAVAPALLARWEREPSLIQVALSSLAGLFPAEGAALRDEIIQLARRYPGSGVAVFCDLLVALIEGDAQRAGRQAELLGSDLGGVDPADLDAPGLPIEIKAAAIVWDACLCLAAP